MSNVQGIVYIRVLEISVRNERGMFESQTNNILSNFNTNCVEAHILLSVY